MEKMDKVVLSAPTGFVYDKRKDGWKLLADVPLGGEPTLELAEFLRDGESYVSGEIMLARAMELGQMAGQSHAERMLVLASKIPESWRAFVPVFPGTVWRDQDGDRFVPYFYRYGGRWFLLWHCLDGGWGRDDRLVRLSK